MNTMVIAIWSMGAKMWDIYEVDAEWGGATVIKADTSAEDLLMFVDTERKGLFALRKNVMFL